MQKLFYISVLFFLFQPLSNAQPTPRNLVVFDSGDLVVSTTGRVSDGELTTTSQMYSDLIVGVFNETTGISNIPSIVQSGIAYIKFDAGNGHVYKGDYVTSSSISGYGMKADHPGMVVGIALESSNSLTGLLKIRVQPSWVKN